MSGIRSDYRSEYVYGNTVRQAVPQEKREHKTVHRHHVEQEYVNEKALVMSAPHVIFLAVVSFVCLFTCVAYLHVQSNITATRSNISELKSNISTVQSQNNALDYSINSYVNVNRVYKIATKKLGMKQATDKQISNYKASDSGYTLQYGDIPSK